MDPARMFKESLTSRPELENSQGHSRRFCDFLSVHNTGTLSRPIGTGLLGFFPAPELLTIGATAAALAFCP